MKTEWVTEEPVGPRATGSRRPSIHFGSGFRLRRSLIMVGWLLLAVILVLGIRGGSPVHFISAAILTAALWPVTVRSGEIWWDGNRVLVRRYFRYTPVEAEGVEAAVVTPPMFRRQSLVLRLRRPLHFSRYVYCRLAPGTVCDAWALIQGRDWEPR